MPRSIGKGECDKEMPPREGLANESECSSVQCNIEDYKQRVSEP